MCRCAKNFVCGAHLTIRALERQLCNLYAWERVHGSERITSEEIFHQENMLAELQLEVAQ